MAASRWACPSPYLPSEVEPRAEPAVDGMADCYVFAAPRVTNVIAHRLIDAC
jgi:transposase